MAFCVFSINYFLSIGDFMYCSNPRNFIFRLILFAILAIFIISACSGIGGGLPGVSTWTPSASPTPTCDPNISLSTPSGWSTNSQLFIILFDPTSVGDEFLEFANGEKTQNVVEFISRIIPSIIRPSDQISIFQLGYRKYENARYLRVYSYIDLPQLYDTPFPQNTLTALPVKVDSTLDGFLIKQATLQAEKTQVSYSLTSTAIISDNKCKIEVWNDSAVFTATSYKETEIAEISTIKANITDVAITATNVFDNILPAETPYSNQVVYEGLYHASFDILSDCDNYDKCVLLIIDTLNSWTYENQLCDNCNIDLKGIDLVYVIMPNCKDINQPTCTKLQDFWDTELTKYGAPTAVYQNGVRAEINLLETIRR